MNPGRIHPTGAAWLYMDSPDTPMQLGVLALFSLPRRASADFLSSLADELRHDRRAVSPWNLRLAPTMPPPVLPRLEEDADFDLDYHFRHTALPAPGGERELGMVVSRLHSNPLDRGRPLWELHLIEGLNGGRFAVYLKIHRAMVEGINALPLLLSFLSESPRRRGLSAPWTIGPEDTAGRRQDPHDSLLDNANSMGRAALGLLQARLRRDRSGSFLVPDGAPYSTLNRPINQQRRFATQQIDEARIERLATSCDSTVNELLTYLCGSSLRRFFKEYNALPDESLVGLIPVSLKERRESNPGGAIAGIRVELGTHIGNPLKRLAAVKKSIQAVRRDRQSLPEEAASSYALMRATPLMISQSRPLGRFLKPLFNVHVSASQGPESPRYFNGARLEALYPMNQLLQYTALSIDCVSYAGTLNIGFTGARDTLPHLQRLAVYLGQALEDLEELVYAPEDAA